MEGNKRSWCWQLTSHLLLVTWRERPGNPAHFFFLFLWAFPSLRQGRVISGFSGQMPAWLSSFCSGLKLTKSKVFQQFVNLKLSEEFCCFQVYSKIIVSQETCSRKWGSHPYPTVTFRVPVSPKLSHFSLHGISLPISPSSLCLLIPSTSPASCQDWKELKSLELSNQYPESHCRIGVWAPLSCTPPQLHFRTHSVYSYPGRQRSWALAHLDNMLLLSRQEPSYFNYHHHLSQLTLAAS